MLSHVSQPGADRAVRGARVLPLRLLQLAVYEPNQECPRPRLEQQGIR